MSGFVLDLMGGDGMEPFGLFPFGLLNASGSLLILAGVVVLAVWAFRALAGPARMSPPPQPVMAETPQDILARRLASGDITAEEYQRARDVLGGSPPP
jgi:putative membrane protein